MRSNKRLSVLALAVVAAGMSLTACGPDDSSASGPTSSPSTSAATPGAAAGQDSSSSSGSEGSDSQGGKSGSGDSGSSDSPDSGSKGADPGSADSGSASSTMCKTSNLEISAEHGISDEGMELIHFKNVGSSSCMMHGFAGVDLKNGSDTVSVSRYKGSDVPTVTLAPGERNEAVMYYPFNNSGGSGYTFTTMVVTPPNETHSASIGVSVNIPLDNPGQGAKPDAFFMNAVGGGK